MSKISILTGTILLFVALSLFGCGVPKADYAALAAERDSANTELKTIKNDVAQLAAPTSALAKKAALAARILSYEGISRQVTEAIRMGKEEEKVRLASEGLVIFKTFDALVTSIGDGDLSKYWGETWPQRAQQDSESNKTVMYNYLGYAKFAERLSILIKTDTDKLTTMLPK